MSKESDATTRKVGKISDQPIAERVSMAYRGNEARRLTLSTAQDIAALNEYIVSVSESPELVKAFREDPIAALTTANVRPELAELVAAGERYIGATLGGGGKMHGNDNTVTVVVVVVVVV